MTKLDLYTNIIIVKPFNIKIIFYLDRQTLIVHSISCRMYKYFYIHCRSYLNKKFNYIYM